MQAEAPGHEWWFILGWDALADLPNWRQPQRILELARLALAQRGDEAAGDGAALPPAAPRGDPEPG